MTGGPTSASMGSPLGRRSFIPGTPRFVRFISLLSDDLRERLLPPAQSWPQLPVSVDHRDDQNPVLFD
jgi:hypothetical protein